MKTCESSTEFIPSCEHQDEEIRLLCVTCGKNVCYQCAFVGHKDHEVYSEEQFDDKILMYRNLLEGDLEEVYRMIESFEQDLNVREGNINEDIQNEIAIITLQFHDSMAIQLQTAELKRSNIIKSRESTLKMTATELKYLSSLSRQISKNAESKGYAPDLMFLQNLNTYQNQISEGIKQAKYIIENLKDMEIYVRFCPMSISAKYVDITVGPIVGSVRINENQVVIVTDQRHQDQPAIRLSCVSCDNTAHMYWSHVIASECFLGFGKKLPTVAVCNSMLLSTTKIHILIGCGTKIFQITILEPQETCYFNSFIVKDVSLPEGSELTCLSVILSLQLPAGVIITNSVSHSITRLDRNLLTVETLELRERPHVATGIMHSNTLKYAYSDGKVVKIIHGASPKVIIRTLESPKSEYTLYPSNMFHDYTDFIILWKSNGGRKKKEKLYKVMAYREDGNSVRLNCEGTYSTRNEAIGISFVKNHGLLCLADGKVVLYDTL